MIEAFRSSRIRVFLGCLLVSLGLACTEEVARVGNGPDPAPDVGVDGGEPLNDCSDITFRDQSYNCDELDRCTEDDFNYRLGCCECDPALCNPPPGGCVDLGVNPPPDGGPPPRAETCMTCHNGSNADDYANQQGLSNPHPFPPAANISCSGCHGGNPNGAGPLEAHVPPPTEIGGATIAGIKNNLIVNPVAYFNRLSLAGIDKMADNYSYPERPGETFSPIDYLQFINPGDLRVVADGRGCGTAGCHANEHAQWVPRSTIATTTGLFSVPRFNMGVQNRVPEQRASRQFPADGDSLADTAPRNVSNQAYNQNLREVGEVKDLLEQPEYAGYNGPMRDNFAINAANLDNDIDNTDLQRPNRVRDGSQLEKLIGEQVSVTCGNCHLYSAGDNNRYADFRSSGCTACHMEYGYDGRFAGKSQIPVNRLEPLNPDQIVAPERPHVYTHQIRNVAKVVGENRAFIRGISDRACVGCHQGSNRTVLQSWGIRMDQNQDVTNNFQYPANPVTFTNTEQDDRLYNPGVGNATFNGRDFNQHLRTEDYDGDGRDDTPEDVHYEAGLKCIDCHGSKELHGGTAGDSTNTNGAIFSRQDQATTIQCVNCHGTTREYASVTECNDYNDQPAICAVDSKGNPLRHVTRDGQGHFWLISRFDQSRHYVLQTLDVVVNNPQRIHPLTSTPLYNPKASYAMGTADGNPSTGTGPLQANPQLVSNGFNHTDTMDCASCHASWVNNCIGCHLATEYNVNPDEYFFSNITGERILLKENAADFVYQTPLAMYLGVNSRGKISQISPAEKVFYRYVDLEGNTSNVYAFSDRLGEGNNPNGGRNIFPALTHNQMAAHSIRGKVSVTEEGPRYCVACHLNQAQLDNFGDEYAAFVQDYDNRNYANIDFNLLQQHIGQNTGNQLNSPFFPRMVSGLGTALFLFDENGCPVNPLDDNDNRQNCNGVSPQDQFDANNVAYDLDRIVEYNGIPNAGGNHPMLGNNGPQALRAGATNPQMAGPLGATTLQKLIDPNVGKVLDSWLDADGNPQGDAANYLQ